MISKSTLVGSQCVVVLNAITKECFDAAIVTLQRHRDSNLATKSGKQTEFPVIITQTNSRFLEELHALMHVALGECHLILALPS